jgi:nicotinamide-nucleotide amidase
MKDLTSLGAAAGALLKARGDTVTVAESSAGGLISAALLAMPGASAYFRGGIVGYTTAARREFLQHAPDAFIGAPPSSEEYALRMARLARDRLGSTWGIAETGAAGPTGNRYGHAAGHACVAVVGPVERAVTIETRCSRREENMWMFAAASLDLLEACLRDAAAARS